MPNVIQIPALLNSLTEQTVGLKNITVTNAADIVALGNAVLSNPDNVDDFFGTLADRIGRTIFNVRLLELDSDLFLMMNTLEYGIILQKIYVDPQPASDNDTWGLEDGQDYSPFIINKPTVKQKLFTGMAVWSYDYTLPRAQMKTAFLGEEQIAAFISCIMAATENNIRLSLKNTARIAYANYIAQKLYASKQTGTKGVAAIYVLADYNNLTGESLTPVVAMRTPAFLRYLAQQINLWYKRMADMSTLFNLDGYYRHTPARDMRVTVLQELSSAMNIYLQSDVFHNELTGLPNYTEVNFWQAEGTKYETATTSAISVQIEAPDGTSQTVTQNGIVAVINDIEAIGMTVMNRDTTSQFNPRTRTENIFNKGEIQYYNDLSENGIVFSLGDYGSVPSDTVVTAKGAKSVK